MASSLHKWAQTRVGGLAKEIKRARESLNQVLNDERKPYNMEEINKK